MLAPSQLRSDEMGDGKGSQNPGFGDRVRTLRAAAGLTQAELAEQASVSERTISDLERGLRGTVYQATARQLAGALGVSAADLPGFLSEARGKAPESGRAGEFDTFDRGGRVPIPLTRLLGRENELTRATSLINDPAVRMVTIVGPGGIGKTRLAIEVANTSRAGDGGGSFFVSLSATDDPDTVLPLIAKAVGLTPEIGEMQLAVSGRLGDEPTLVLLDTFEHLVAAAPAVGSLLEACPTLTVLATSRVPLRVRGEHEVPLQPLAVRAGAEQPANAPAVELFIERASAVAPGFDTSPSTLEVAAEICSRLDGLPLAIELAAARIRHMPIGDLRRQLDHRLDPLVGGARDLPARQQTMRGTLDWSYALLGASEMRLFRSLAAFRGGFGRDAVAAISRSVEAGDGVDPMASLMDLVDSSLVLAGAGASGEARYRLLDVTREYAVERLRLAIQDADVLYLQQWSASRSASGAARDIDAAAEINSAYGGIAGNLVGSTLGDALAKVHGEDAVRQCGDTLHVVIYQEYCASIAAEVGNELGEGIHFAGCQSCERLVDQHHPRVAGNRLGQFHPAQVGERKRAGFSVQHASQSDPLGNLLRLLAHMPAGHQFQQLIRQ